MCDLDVVGTFYSLRIVGFCMDKMERTIDLVNIMEIKLKTDYWYIIPNDCATNLYIVSHKIIVSLL